MTTVYITPDEKSQRKVIVEVSFNENEIGNLHGITDSILIDDTGLFDELPTGVSFEILSPVELLEVPDDEHLNSLLLAYFNTHGAVLDPKYHFAKGYREYESLITPLIASQKAEIEKLRNTDQLQGFIKLMCGDPKIKCDTMNYILELEKKFLNS